MFMTTPTVFPMIFGRRHPDKLNDGSSTPLKLVRLQVEQKVNGSFPFIHQVAFTMTFKNTFNIIIEGAFEFTLPEKATICGYGLDIDGAIVDGVVVEKQAARIIFEKEVRKRIDPGFVELVTGNVFRTRVYPIEPQKTRTVRVIYQDQALPDNTGFLYQIPIQYQTQLESLDIVLTCFDQGTTIQPSFLPNTNQILPNSPSFLKKSNGEYTAEWHLINVQPTNTGDQTLSYILPDSLRSVISAVEKDANIGAYFAISCALPVPTEQRMNQLDVQSKTVCILWDASLSRSNSQDNRLLELNSLKKIFDLWLTRVRQIDIILIIFRHEIDEQKTFQLQFHNWNDFLSLFENIPYDGATNLSKLTSINLNQSVNYYFLFSDCISTINGDEINGNFYTNFKAPIWIFNGNHLHEPYDIDFIRYLTQYNEHGGGYLNREKLQLNSNDLNNLIETIQIKYNQCQSVSTLQKLYPSNSISIPLNSNRFLLVGQIPNPLPNSIQFELEFSMNNKTTRLPISVNIPSNESIHFGLLRRLWAQEKLNELNAFKDKNKAEIVSHGLEYSLVTTFTSLLVLESLQQHLQYHVCPAKSRTAMYNGYMMQHKTVEYTRKTSSLPQLISQWNQKCQWYDHVITDADRHQAYIPSSVFSSSTTTSMLPTQSLLMNRVNSVFPVSHSYQSPLPASSFSVPFAFGSSSQPQQQQQQQRQQQSNSFGSNQVIPATITTSTAINYGSSSSLQPSNHVTNIPKEISSAEQSSTIVFNVNNSQSSYITRMSSVSDRTNAYWIYLKERPLERQSPSFYFDIASYFFSPISSSSILDIFNQKSDITQPADQKSIDYGLRILTNILELELEAPQLYRTVAYKLMELKQWNLALTIFRKIYSLRSDEPQSVYDLAMILIELGEYNQALEYFHQLLTQTWDERFRTIQIIALSDFNRLLLLINQATPGIDFRLTRHLPADIRILVKWDTPDTSIVVSIKEPTSQICSNRGSNHTGIGGFITNTSYQMDQPVEYLLRQAINGIYTISLTYATNAQHTMTGVTTVLVYIYKYFGSFNEEKQIQTVRLTDLNQTIEVGRIEFGDRNLEKLKDELEKTKDECRRLQDQLLTSKGQPISSSIQHVNVTCDGCSKTPIVGNRYKCLFCPNTDFCQNCYLFVNNLHDSNHPFICIRDSSLYPSAITIQNISQIVHLNIKCAQCAVSPIVGIRYQCLKCGINLCEKCEFLGLHDNSHQRLKILYPQ